MKRFSLVIAFLLLGSFVYALDTQIEEPRKLKSIEEHNSEKFRAFEILNSGTPCGVACPECGAELLADYTISLTSNPPQTPVRCPKCGWNGSIF